jgi:hypothetical protein
VHPRNSVTGNFVREPVTHHVHVAAQYEKLIGERQRRLDLVPGLASFCRLSRPPCEVRIFTFTPLRSMIFRYLSAVVRNELPSGPLAMTMVRVARDAHI